MSVAPNKVYKLLLHKALFFLFLSVSKVATAQVQVMATNTSTPVSYSRLKLAFDAINNGTHTGIVYVNIVGNTVETESAVLNQQGTNGSSYQQVNITPSGGVARTIEGSFTGYLIDLNGADNVFINGLNTDGNSLTISSTGTGMSAAIRFINDASSNTLANVTLKGASVSDGVGIVFFDVGTGTGNDGNTISSCTIQPSTGFASKGIYSRGGNGTVNDGIVIMNNIISNIFSASSVTAAIDIASGNSGWDVNGNIISSGVLADFQVSNIHYGINVAAGDGYNISFNRIGFASSTGTGMLTLTSAANVSSRYVGISLAVGINDVTSVQGNLIGNISLQSSSNANTSQGVLCGIHIQSGIVNVGTSTGNTIGSTSGLHAFVLSDISNTATIVGISVSSTGAITISNNNLGGFTNSNATVPNISGSIIGVNISSAVTSLIVNSNTIGNTTAANMRVGVNNFTTTVSIFTGIWASNLAIGSARIANNTIQNAAAYGTAASIVRGIATIPGTSSTTYSITSNTIQNLLTNGNSNSVINGLVGAFGIGLTAGSNSFVSNNTISNISNVSASATTGIAVSGISIANAINTTVSKNRIFGINNTSNSSSATAPPVAAGILVRSASSLLEISNNMISLGTGQTSNTAFIGIWMQNGVMPNPLANIFFNSVSIAGSVSTGSQPSFAFARTDFSATARVAAVNIKNNIFSNARTGGTGKHYAIANNFGATAVTTGWVAGASNSNVLNASSATVGFWSGDKSFTEWASASNGDAASFSGVTVNWVDVASADLHITGTHSIIEAAGTTVPSILDDFDGNIRANLSPVDIGAHAGNFSQSPIIEIAPLFNICGIGSRTLVATITDTDAGVPTAGSGLPRLFWRINQGSFQAVTATFIGGNQYGFTFGGGATIGDSVYYYLVAQDSNGNTGSLPSAGVGVYSSNPPSVTNTPATFFSYLMANPLSGNYTVGVGQNFATITAAIDNYNKGCLTGPVTFTLTDAQYTNETLPITINFNNTASATNTLTIKPATGVTPLIQGTSDDAVFVFRSAKFVTIDGAGGTTPNSVCPASEATRGITISNNSTNSGHTVVSILNDGITSATNINIQNCNIIGGTNSSNTIGINISGTSNGSGISAVANSFVSLINNRITAVGIGVFAAGSSATTRLSNVTIQQNHFDGDVATSQNIGRAAVMVLFGANISVSANTIKNIFSYSSSIDVGGIFLGTNSVSTRFTSAADCINSTLSNNIIDGIVNTTSFSAVGVVAAAGNAATNTIANNFISNVYANGTVGDLGVGILVIGGNGTTHVYNNSVTMNNNSALTGGTFPNVALAVLGNNPRVQVVNNILVANGPGNGAPIGNVALAYGYAVPADNLITNRNILFSNGVGAQLVLQRAFTSAVVGYGSLPAWQAASQQDAQSQNFLPEFVSSTDLHIQNSASNQAQIFAGTPVGINTDIDCNTRNTNTPFIGADEIAVTVAAPTASNQTFPSAVTVASLVASGTNLQWFNVSVGGLSLAANTVIGASGTYYVSSGGAFGMFSARVSIIVTITNSTTWNGTSWDNGNPTSSINAFIGSTITPPATFSCLNLTINSGAALSLAGINAVVRGNITNNGNGITGNGTLFIFRNCALFGNPISIQGTLNLSVGTLTTNGLLIISPTGAIVNDYANISGTVTLQQNIVGQRGWRVFSNPFTTTQTIATLATNNGISISNTASGASGLTDVRTYTNGTGWNNVTANTLAANTPYALFVRGLANEVTGLNYSGGPTAFTYNASGTLNGNSVSITPSATGFSLVGNPFAAPVNSSALTNGAGKSYFVYQIARNGDGRTRSGGWSAQLTSSATSPIPTLGVIAYQAGNNTSYDISTSTDINTTNAAATGLFRTQQAQQTQQQNQTIENLALVVEQNGALQDNLFIRQDEASTSGTNDVKDLLKLTNDNVNFYTVVKATNQRLAIDARDVRKDNATVPLGITAAQGNYTLRVTNNNIEKVEATLVDNYLQTRTLLNNNSSYNFSVTADSNTRGNNRFEVQFNNKLNTTSIPTTINNGFTAKVLGNSNVNNMVSIEVKNAQKQVTITVTDAQGRVLATKQGANGVNRVQVSLINGLYLVQVTDGNSIVTEKILN